VDARSDPEGLRQVLLPSGSAIARSAVNLSPAGIRSATRRAWDQVLLVNLRSVKIECDELAPVRVVVGDNHPLRRTLCESERAIEGK